ncbi:hypothetical protein HPB49_018193 [Dermacentor silvarum]|uniref:Uncharacterized protein n=1 Tax=Dermacentor silvarum TaxID=543639 RepID=A0ACB8CZ63_DERSI|nr:hypothetical protein HPB49_018193 [Dermacentor silvarum]
MDGPARLLERRKRHARFRLPTLAKDVAESASSSPRSLSLLLRRRDSVVSARLRLRRSYGSDTAELWSASRAGDAVSAGHRADDVELCGMRTRHLMADTATVGFSVQVDPGGKAEAEGRIRVGDLVLCVNEVPCSRADQARQLVDSAFNTLTLLVWRRQEARSGVHHHRKEEPAFQEKNGKAQTSSPRQISFERSRTATSASTTKRGSGRNARAKMKTYRMLTAPYTRSLISSYNVKVSRGVFSELASATSRPHFLPGALLRAAGRHRGIAALSARGVPLAEDA